MVAINKKLCTECNRAKSLMNFSADIYSSHGKRSKCKSCVQKYNKEYVQNHQKERKAYNLAHQDEKRIYNLKYRREHKKEIQKYNKEYRQTHLEEKVKYNREYRQKHPEKCKLWVRKYRQRHLEERKAYLHTYYQKHIEENAAYDRQRRAKKNAVQEDFGSIEARFVRTFWSNRCAVCNKTKQEEKRALAIDHWRSLSKGYALTIDNAVLLCKSCNSSKHVAHPEDIFTMKTVARIEKKIQEQVQAWKQRRDSK